MKWLQDGSAPPVEFIAYSNLLLEIKFLFFFRAIDSFGVYFAIIIGVARRIFSFLLILGIIIMAYGHSLYILLRPRLDEDDSNSNTNMLAWLDTSFLATYFYILTGNSIHISNSLVF